MGDRANVYVKNTETAGVFLYMHWQGYDLPEIVRTALARKERWDDDSYLARIIFDQMTDGDRGTTGYGISAVMCDNEHPIIYVDCKAMAIGFTAEPAFGEQPKPPAEMVPFARFIETAPATYPEGMRRGG